MNKSKIALACALAAIPACASPWALAPPQEWEANIQVLDPGVSNWQASMDTQGPAFVSNVAAQYNAAFNAVQSSYTPTGWEVLIPHPAGVSTSTEEFLTFASTPEPVSIILLGTVLVAVGAITRMRMTKRRRE
jgi:hypothetical protein